MFTYIANWKTNVSYKQAERLLVEHHEALRLLGHKTDIQIVICPSFPSLNLFHEIVNKDNAIALGAQDCSPFPNGPHTGDVDALSLKQLGCTYCIVGHSERRQIYKETDELIAQKVAQLQLNGITPIVCVGETSTEKNNGDASSVIQKQLEPILTVSAATQGNVWIAYEPVWAIGSGLVPPLPELTGMIDMIRIHLKKSINQKISILYGGGVTAESIGTIRTIPGINGVLIGSASTDFHSLQKIVS